MSKRLRESLLLGLVAICLFVGINAWEGGVSGMLLVWAALVVLPVTVLAGWVINRPPARVEASPGPDREPEVAGLVVPDLPGESERPAPAQNALQ